jgi:hypothetical protein
MNYANQYKKLLNLDRDSLFCSPNVERGIRPRSSPKPGLEPIYGASTCSLAYLEPAVASS